MSWRARRRVEQAFEDWAAEMGMLPAGVEAVGLWRDRIDIVLQGREDYLHRPDPTLWRSGDVHRLLIDHLPPRQVDAWGLAEHGVDTVRDFLRFLADTGRLHPGSTKIATLLKELDRAAAIFTEAMADTSRYRLAKRVLTVMRADGLGFDSDPAEVDRWAERFSALDAGGRRRVLGELMDQNPGYATGHLLVHGGQVAILQPGMPPDKRLVWPDEVPCDCGCADTEPASPPVLPSHAELAAAVAGSETLRRLSGLADWVGIEGRPVDRRGEPARKDVAAAAAAVGLTGLGARPMRDVPALAALWDLALELDVLSLRHARAIPGGTVPVLRAALRRDGDLEQAMQVWDDVFDEFVHPASDVATSEQEALRNWMQPWTPHLLGNLYREFADGEFAVVERAIADVIAQRAGNHPGGSELLDALATTTLLRSLSVLAELGAVEIDVPAPPEELSLQAAAAAQIVGMSSLVLSAPERRKVRLTSLGRRSVYKRLAGEQVAAVSPMASLASAGAG